MLEREGICIIDDDTDLLTLFSDALKSSGFRTTGFNDPVEAIEYLRKHHNEFGLVVTDWRMPKMDGSVIIKLISQTDPSIGIMMISAFDFDDEELHEITKEDFLQKPIHIEQFIETIRQKVTPIYEICVG